MLIKLFNLNHFYGFEYHYYGNNCNLKKQSIVVCTFPNKNLIEYLNLTLLLTVFIISSYNVKDFDLHTLKTFNTVNLHYVNPN